MLNFKKHIFLAILIINLKKEGIKMTSKAPVKKGFNGHRNKKWVKLKPKEIIEKYSEQHYILTKYLLKQYMEILQHILIKILSIKDILLH